jgi:NAD(P)-dependent dehydrogenase (short-subunit alcohol dehydrogenase family)
MLERDRVGANCVHPGGVNTNFANNNGSLRLLLFRTFRPFMRSPQRGADTIVYLASSPEAGGTSGKCFMDRKEVSPAQPRDEALQKRPWEVSEELTNHRVPS